MNATVAFIQRVAGRPLNQEKPLADVTDLEDELFERARKNPGTMLICAKAKRQQQLRRGVID